MTDAERAAYQNAINPAYIPRNHVLQDVIAATESGDADAVCHLKFSGSEIRFQWLRGHILCKHPFGDSIHASGPVIYMHYRFLCKSATRGSSVN